MKKLLALLLAVTMLFTCMAFAEETATEHYVIYGSSTEISGDFTPSAWWSNNATDATIRDLCNGYETVSTDQGGDIVVNETVTKSIETTENEDGGKTFTIAINEGLVWNNGDPITAKDYVGYLAFMASPVAKDLGTSFTLHTQVAGAADYREGNAAFISGVKLIDDYTFSVTYMPTDTSGNTLFPYFYEMSYASFSPLNLKYWLGEGVEVADDGEGVYLVGAETEAVKAVVEAARYNWVGGAVSCGPYNLLQYDASAKEAILVKNDNFAGNFEGQVPALEKIVIVKAEDATFADALKTGAFNFYDTIADGAQVNTVLDIMEDETVTEALGYNFDYCQFDRPGYGAVFFMCDFGPTQFQAVRQAIAHLLDRNEFANTFCQGWGGVVSVPAGPGLWQYQDSEEWLNENLNTYPYDYEEAVRLLVEDGWIYNADGSDWTADAGVRYKKVTAEEAGTYAGNVTLEDGTILMPLSLEWSSSEGNSVSELLKVMLAENPDVAAAGIKINQNIMTFAELLNYYYRDETAGEKYGVPTYAMFNLANNFSAPYSQAYEYTLDMELVDGGYNSDRIFDEELDKLSMDMVYGLSADQIDEHLDMFQKLMDRWNELLPAMPLYSNIYVTAYPTWLENYEQDSFWNFQQAILYATIAE